MSNPVERLKEFRNSLGLSQPKFANEIGMPASTINSIECGKQKLPFKLAYAIEEKFGLKKEWLLDGEGEPYAAKIQKPDVFSIELIKDLQASAGGGCSVLNESETEKIDLPNNKNIKFVKVSGESMYPNFFNGDIIAFDISKTDITEGKTYLISIDGELFIKQLIKLGPHKINVVSINEKIAPPFEVDLRTDNVKICGCFSWLIRM